MAHSDTRVAASVSFQVLLHFDYVYSVIFFVGMLCMYIYKGTIIISILLTISKGYTGGDLAGNYTECYSAVHKA